MKITTNIKENKKQYLTRRYRNEPGLYLSDNGNQVWIVDTNGSVVGFFGVNTSAFHSVKWDGREDDDDQHVVYCKIYHAPKNFELNVLQ